MLSGRIGPKCETSGTQPTSIAKTCSNNRYRSPNAIRSRHTGMGVFHPTGGWPWIMASPTARPHRHWMAVSAFLMCLAALASVSGLPLKLLEDRGATSAGSRASRIAGA